MSHSLRALRDLFGDGLLVRAGKGMALTHAGPASRWLRGLVRGAVHHTVVNG